MDHDDDFNTKEDNVPWGKYTYHLEGLATGCYLEGTTSVDLNARPGAPEGQRLRFRVDLPDRCFILSMAIKLPNAPEAALKALDDVCVERTLRTGEYEMIHDGVLSNKDDCLNLKKSDPALDKRVKGKRGSDKTGISPVSVEATAQSNATDADRKRKVLEIRRAADSLRITLADIDAPPGDTKIRDYTDSDSCSEDGGVGDVRILGVTVVGYVRGQTPKAGRIQILLNSSTRLGLGGSPADRAEVYGLLGLAFLGNRRYRQAAELLERASILTKQVALDDSKKGYAGDLGYSWASELNLLAAHAYFEHVEMSSEGVACLVAVVAPPKRGSSLNVANDVRRGTLDFLDLRTELLGITAPLMEKLVRFLGESKSLAVQMASARMIEFVGEQLGCAIAPYMGKVLDQVLRSYPLCKPLGARERAAAASFSYDSMEDCYERLVDICCRLLPLTEHSVLQRILENTLIPVLHEAFDESKYLLESEDVEEEADDLLCQAVAQTLRLIYLVLTVLGGDASVRPYFITKILDMLIAEGGHSRTPMLLRRSALHVWDALTKAMVQSATSVSVKQYKEYITVQMEYMSNLIVTMKRKTFTYEDQDGNEFNADSEMPAKKNVSKSMQAILDRRTKKTIIADRHTLRRLLTFMKETFSVLEPCSDDDERHTATTAILGLQRTLGEAAADIFVSSLMDVSYHAATVSGNGAENNVVFEHKTFANQLKVSCDALHGILECYWAALALLPQRSAEEAEKNFILRPVLTWCVERMQESAPPKGMLRLLLCVVRGFQNEVSVSFKNISHSKDAEDEASALDLYRANNLWLARTAHVEALELHDILCPIVGKHLMAKDIVDVITALGNQAEAEGFDDRADISVGVLSSVVALTAPAKPELTKKSLKDLVDPKLDKQRIVNGFPKSSTSSRFPANPLSRKLRFSSTNTETDPMSASLYLHIVMSSCFDFFESLSSPAKRSRGATYIGLQLDAFIEHAALLVRCLKDCAKHQKHREYIGATLGDILATCLGMQNHGDGRVRLAGFEIFASALDVLFLAEETSSSLTQQFDSLVSDTAGLGAMQVRTISSLSSATANATNTEESGSVKELAPTGDKGERRSSLSNQQGNEPSKLESKSSNQTESSEAGAPTKEEQDEKLQEIYINGGAYVFRTDSLSSSALNFEENGWHMLCSFMTESLGIGKYADFVVRRACLEYLRQCILKALQGSASGASVISFAHVGQIWDAVLRLVDSPVQSLNSLAFWVICATINMGIYSAVLGRGASKQRRAELEEFVMAKLFTTAENYMKSGNKESRLWGIRLLEVYFRARSMNSHSLEVCPVPPRKILMALNGFKTDWCKEARDLAKSLLDMHYDIPVKKQSTPSSSFSDKAQSFMNIKRLGYHDDNADSTTHTEIELWFPALPQATTAARMEKFGRTLESFANTEIEGGEETDLSEDEEDDEEYGEEEDEDEYVEDDDDVEYDEEANEQGVYVEDAAPEMNDNAGKDQSPVTMDDDESLAEQEFAATIVKPANRTAAEPETREEHKVVKPEPPEKVSKPTPQEAVSKPVTKEKLPDKGTGSPKSEEEDIDDWPDIGTSVDEEVELVGAELLKVVDDSPKVKRISEKKAGGFVPSDMDEKMPTIRRTGSFIGRPSKAITAEGEAPKLEKRKSVDAVMIGSKSFNRLVGLYSKDRDVESGPSSSRRVGYRDIASKRNEEQGALSPKEAGGPPSSKSMSGSRSSKDVVNAGFLPIRNSRVKRGVNLEDEIDEPGRDATVQPSSSGGASSEAWRLKHESTARSGSVSRGRRSLPRAPAFLKPSVGQLGSGSNSNISPPLSPPPPAGGRPRVPRARSSSRGLRLPDDDAAKRTERTQRFGKRDFNIPVDFNAESDSISPVTASGALSPGVRVGVPKSDASSGRGIGSDKRLGKRAGSSTEEPSSGARKQDDS